MHVVANTDQLVEDGIITAAAAKTIEDRGRETMMGLAINAILCVGILFATFGLIFWLASALSVAICGVVLLAGGLVILAKGGEIYRMFGNAAALIGSGMLVAGAGIELIDKYEDIASWFMIPGGALLSFIALRAFVLGGLTTRFVQGAIGLMGIGLHLTGLGFLLLQHDASGIWPPLFFLYTTALLLGVGWLTDVRLITALAVVPFAQALDTGTFYFHAAYVFVSPESTLSIVQLSLATALALWVLGRSDERTGRHARITATMTFIVANLCALVGSLWGDWIGETVWGPGSFSGYGNYSSYIEARDAFRADALFISPEVYTIVWAIALAAIIVIAAHRTNRALFNAGVTFAAIHAYTQMFETFADEPLAYVIGGFGAVGLAWAVWRLNKAWMAYDDEGSAG